MSTLATTDDGDVVVGLGAWWCRLCLGAAGQLWRLLEESPGLRAASSRCLHLEIWILLSPSFLSVLVLVNWCCLWVQRMDFSGRVRYLVQQWIHVLREALDEFLHFLRCGELES